MIDRERLSRRVGAELRAIREGNPQITLQLLGDHIDAHRTQINKIEMGTKDQAGVVRWVNIGLVDYLRLADFLQDSMGQDHPAVLLVKHFNRTKRGWYRQGGPMRTLNLSLHAYLALIDHMRGDLAADHPAVLLLDHFK